MTSWACPAQLLSPSSSPKARWEHCAPGPVCSGTGNPGTCVDPYGPKSCDLWPKRGLQLESNPPEVWTHRWRKPSSSRTKAPWRQVRARDPMTSKEFGALVLPCDQLMSTLLMWHLSTLVAPGNVALLRVSQAKATWPSYHSELSDLFPFEESWKTRKWNQLCTSQTFGASDP